MKVTRVIGWKVGFRKIAFTNMLRREFKYSLKDAKAACDAVLDNHSLELEVQEFECERIASELNALGAQFEMKINV